MENERDDSVSGIYMPLGTMSLHLYVQDAFHVLLILFLNLHGHLVKVHISQTMIMDATMQAFLNSQSHKTIHELYLIIKFLAQFVEPF